MKKTTENRYPNSATLFRFCKEALEIRYDGNVKVIDQDVGAILGYDPADCSHWKKGKKNIRALSTLKNIAEHLSIDERLLIDITAGKIGLDEAVFEYKGYGEFYLASQNLESMKKNFFKNPGKWQTEATGKSFEEIFDVNRPLIAELVQEVIELGKFKEAPVYIPELMQCFPQVQAVVKDDLATLIHAEIAGEGENTTMRIEYRGSDARPHIRFLIAKQLFFYLVKANAKMREFLNSPNEIQDIRANIFAAMLLVPGGLLRKEVEKIDSSLDIVMQLAETFWVSKALMNQRLSDYMENLS